MQGEICSGVSILRLIFPARGAQWGLGPEKAPVQTPSALVCSAGTAFFAKKACGVYGLNTFLTPDFA